jgi:preprotein translocase subunit SecA
MAEKAANTGPQIFRQMERALLLQNLDQHWKEHLLNLDHLRQGINLRAFGQRDPLNEYKTEAFNLYSLMQDQIRESVTQTLSLVEFNVTPDAQKIMQQRAAAMQAQAKETRDDPALAGAGLGRPQQPQLQTAEVEPFPQAPRRAFDKDDPTTWGKVQRNAPCPCGSDKKFKHCHGKIT